MSFIDSRHFTITVDYLLIRFIFGEYPPLIDYEVRQKNSLRYFNMGASIAKQGEKGEKGDPATCDETCINRLVQEIKTDPYKEDIINRLSSSSSFAQTMSPNLCRSNTDCVVGDYLRKDQDFVVNVAASSHHYFDSLYKDMDDMNLAFKI